MLGSQSARATVLVTGIGGAAGQNLSRALRRSDRSVTIVGADANSYHLAATDCERKALVPSTEKDEYGWLHAIQALASDCDLILPQPDCDVAALSQVAHLPEWQNKLSLPNRDSLQTCQNKYLTYQQLQAANLPVPDTLEYRPSHVTDACKQLGLPLWMRSRYGAGSRGAFKAWSWSQIIEWAHACESNKGIQDTDFILSQYLPGPEYGCQLLYWKGDLIVSQTRERLEYLYGYLTPTGQSSSPSVARTVGNPDLDALADRAVRAIDPAPHGVYGVDMKCREDGQACITEINPGRFFTTIDFLAEAGLNFPCMLLRLHQGEVVPFLGYSPLSANQYWIRVADQKPKLFSSSQLERAAVCRTSLPSSNLTPLQAQPS